MSLCSSLSVSVTLFVICTSTNFSLSLSFLIICCVSQLSFFTSLNMFLKFFKKFQLNVISDLHLIHVQTQHSIHQIEIFSVTDQCYEAVDHLSDQFKMT